MWKTAEITVLKFDLHSQLTNITFRPDMTPLRHALSICGWVKKLRPGNDAIWFGYATEEGNMIAISDTASWMTFFCCQTDHSSRYPVQLGVWFHHCTTWSNQSRRMKVYLNGQLVGLSDISTLEIPLGGWIVIGKLPIVAD